MGRLRGLFRRRRSSRRESASARRGGGKRNFLSAPILILGLILLAFAVSVFNRSQRTLRFNHSDEVPPPILITREFEASPYSTIEVEILNGCGTKGLGQEATKFLRRHSVDVVATENADRFDYDRTVLVLRAGSAAEMELIAGLFDFPVTDSTRILSKPDGKALADITVILGRDFTELKPYKEYRQEKL